MTWPPQIRVELTVTPDGWAGIVHGGTEPYVVRLPQGYDPHDDAGQLVVEIITDALNRGWPDR